jgi:anionic cell wall polymer biosynthesis LytR-Cps2A-Psr (LCP) family protein
MTLGALNGKKCTFVEGKQWVDGDCALRFARERKTYGTGDIHRGENQQQVITAIIAKMSSSKDYFLRLPEVLDAAADLFETSLSRDEIASIIRMQLANQTKWQIESMGVKGVADMQPTYSMGANLPLYVMYPNEDSIKEAQTKINDYLNTSR